MGESSAFGRVGRARSARGRAAEQAMNDTGPTLLALYLLSGNPDNPRDEMGDLTRLGNSLRDHGQKQPLAIMTREAYLVANPGRDAELEPRSMYVVIDGNRRLAAAREAGVKSLKVMLDDELGTDPDQILESALVANVFNKQLEPLEEAKALKQLLEIHGTQERLAERLHRSQGWVSQRLALLGLTPELQERLEAGEESAALLRRVGKKPAEQQESELARLKEEQEREKTEKAARSKVRKETRPDSAVETTVSAEAAGADYYAVINEEPPADADASTKESAEPAEVQPATEGPERAEPEAGAGEGDTEDPLRGLDSGLLQSLPWRDIARMAALIFEYMPEEDVRRLNKHLWARHGE